MTRASDWRSPSRDLITKESFGCQSPLVTTRAPRPLVFSVNVSSVGNTRSGLVSITATACTVRFSYRPGCMTLELVLLLEGHVIRCWHCVARVKGLGHLRGRKRQMQGRGRIPSLAPFVPAYLCFALF